MEKYIKPYKRIFEDELKESKVDPRDVYDYFSDLIYTKRYNPKKAARFTITHFERFDDSFDIYDLVNALDDEYELEDLMEEVLDEACPEGASVRNNQCVKPDNSGYYKGKCPSGAIWDDAAGSTGKCILHTNK